MIYSHFTSYNEQFIDLCGLLKKFSTRGKQSNANHALMHHVWVKTVWDSRGVLNVVTEPNMRCVQMTHEHVNRFKPHIYTRAFTRTRIDISTYRTIRGSEIKSLLC